MSSPSLARLIASGALCALLTPTLALANAAPVVTNVVATQIPNTGQVRVTFNVSDADGDLVTARLICSSNNGATFDLLPVTVSGNVNQQMAAGPGKEIIWDAGRDYPGRYWTQVVAKVICSDGPATSGEMVLVPAGSFVQGDPVFNIERTTYLSAYYIDKYEVTNAEFEQFILAGGYSTQAFWSSAGWTWRSSNNITQPAVWPSDLYHCGPGYPGFPVLGVSWYEAEAYANFAGKRLPTEAEWEKAARGTDQRQFPWGNSIGGQIANYRNSSDPYEESTTPVGYYDGSLQSNPPFQTLSGAGPYGTFDQSGNVSEWVRDWWAGYDPAETNNPIGPPTGSTRVARGGNYRSQYCDGNHTLEHFMSTWWREQYVWDVCSALALYPTLQAVGIGFRCARNAN